ncbi:unnamed protein product [Urochloa decumbens]|uniref:AP2/ERF domain-containing protein n=1 Tax=Urochloa decumbens TaxID=240449 RepID=A0ABC8WE92_9POAL
MSRAANGGGGRGAERRCRYRGVRRRAWGKWVSEIRVPGTRERLWLGSYAAPEAAAVAHDAAACLLRGLAGAAAAGHLNFPERAACYGHGRAPRPLSPRSVQRVASDAGMAADAQLVDARAALAASTTSPPQPTVQTAAGTTVTAASVGIGGAARGGEGAGYAPVPALPPHSNCSSSSSTYWATPSAGGGSRSSSAGSDQQLVYGDISVDDIEILM